MIFFPNEPGLTHRILLLGGTSEIGLAILAALEPDAEVILAGRDSQRLAAAGKELSGQVRTAQVRTVGYDAADTGSHQAFVDAIFDEGPLDLVISAAGVLIGQPEVEADVRRAAEMIDANFTGHVTTLLAIAARMRAQGRGTIVVLSSVAAVRPRRPISSTGRPRPAWMPSPGASPIRCTAAGSGCFWSGPGSSSAG